jgi:hypothetical protein
MNERAAVSRRSALKALGMGAGAAAFVPWLSDEGLLAFQQVQRLKTAPKLLVLSPAQYATLDALAEAIIPASPTTSTSSSASSTNRFSSSGSAASPSWTTSHECATSVRSRG